MNRLAMNLVTLLALLPAGNALHLLSQPVADLATEKAPASWELVNGWKLGTPRHTFPNFRKTKERQRAGVALITVTGKDRIELATKMQSTWKDHMASADVAVHICDPECQKDERLKSVIIMPRDRTGNMTDYERASPKYFYGIMAMQQELVNNKAPVWPEWFLLKDDDTYVSMKNLKRDLSQRDASEFVMLGSKQGSQIMGGGGVALSWRLAEKLFLEHGEDLVNEMMVAHKGEFWDVQMPLMAKKLEPSFTFEDDRNFNHFGPDGNPKGRCQQRETKFIEAGECFDTAACACSRSPDPATFHVHPFGDSTLAQAQRMEES